MRDEKREKRKRQEIWLQILVSYTKCTCEVNQINVDLRLSTAILSIETSQQISSRMQSSNQLSNKLLILRFNSHF